MMIQESNNLNALKNDDDKDKKVIELLKKANKGLQEEVDAIRENIFQPVHIVNACH